MTNINDDTVSIIDVQRGRVSTVLALGAFSVENTVTKASYSQLHPPPLAVAVAVAPDANVWVACNSSSSLAVIDPATNIVGGSLKIGLGDDPTGIACVSAT